MPITAPRSTSSKPPLARPGKSGPKPPRGDGLPQYHKEDDMKEISDITTLAALATRIAELPGALHAKVGDRGSGKERIYVALTKYNGGRGWNGGAGHRVIVHADRRVELDPRCDWAGAATYRRHQELGTLEAIEGLVTSA